MILFKEDHAKYANSYIDYNTKNRSWVKLAYIYKSMGIQNYRFHLTVLDKRVVGLDPHSENLTNFEKAIILREIKYNAWYFFREVLRVPGIAGKDAGHYTADKANISTIWLFLNHITNILVMLRQRGKSLLLCGIINYLLEFRCKDTNIGGMTKDDALRATTIKAIRAVNSELPAWTIKKGANDSKNMEEFTVKKLNNSIRYSLPQRSKKAALLAERGNTNPIFVGDEVAYLANIELSLTSALGAGTAARDFAKEAGAPYGTILVTTAGSKDDRDSKYIYGLMQESAKWTEQFFDIKDEDTLNEVVRRSSRDGLARVSSTFYYWQLGLSERWLKNAIADAMMTEGSDGAKRDFHSIWTSGTGSHPLDKDLLVIIRRNIKPVTHLEIMASGYTIRWYVTEEEVVGLESKKVLIILDSSDAIGSDDLGVVFMCPDTGATLGVGVYNRVNIISFSAWFFKLAMRFHESVLMIERRSTGVAIIDYLLRAFVKVNVDPFKRMYNLGVQYAKEKPERFKEIVDFGRHVGRGNLTVKYKNLFGSATAGSGLASRTALYSDTLGYMTNLCKRRMNDSILIDQLLHIEIRNGRVDHPDDGNDDVLVAWLLGGFMLTKGANLEYYGLRTSAILNNTKQKEETAEDQEQIAIRKEIKDLSKLYVKAGNSIMATRIASKIRKLDTLLTLREEEAANVDQLLTGLDETKYRRDIAQRAPSMQRHTFTQLQL